MGSFLLIVGYFQTIVSAIGSYCEFCYVHRLSILFPLAAALNVVDLILNYLFLHCEYLGALVYYFISSKHWYLENLSYIRKQQEQAEAQKKTISSMHQQWKPVLISGSRGFKSLQPRAVQPVRRD